MQLKHFLIFSFHNQHDKLILVRFIILIFLVLSNMASCTLLQRQFSRITKCRLSFCDFLQEFAQILHEFANAKHTLNLFLLKSSDLKIKRPTSLGKNNKKKLDERSNPVFCLSWLHYDLLLQFFCFFKVRLYCIIY